MYFTTFLSLLASSLLVISAHPTRPGTAKSGSGNPKFMPRGLDPKLGGAVSPLNRPNAQYTTEQMNNIKLSYTTAQRLSYIQSLGNTDDYFKFDFTSAGFSSNAGKGQGGYGFLADVSQYPVLLGTGLSMAIGYIQPCGLDSMHVHNRATEFVVLVSGKSLYTGFTQEDGLTKPILTQLGLYQGTIRPQGSTHYEFNDNCEPAIFVSGLSHEDPGVARTAQQFFDEDPELVFADMGYPEFMKNLNITDYSMSIPTAFSLGAQECLNRCGITYNTTQH